MKNEMRNEIHIINYFFGGWGGGGWGRGGGGWGEGAVVFLSSAWKNFGILTRLSCQHFSNVGMTMKIVMPTFLQALDKKTTTLVCHE